MKQHAVEAYALVNSSVRAVIVHSCVTTHLTANYRLLAQGAENMHEVCSFY